MNDGNLVSDIDAEIVEDLVNNEDSTCGGNWVNGSNAMHTGQ